MRITVFQFPPCAHRLISLFCIIIFSTACNNDYSRNVLIFEQTASPGSSIPDDTTIGVSDTITSVKIEPVSKVEVDIVSAHPDWGELKIIRESPPVQKNLEGV
jgi:hypothetical protein